MSKSILASFLVLALLAACGSNGGGTGGHSAPFRRGPSPFGGEDRDERGGPERETPRTSGTETNACGYRFSEESDATRRNEVLGQLAGTWMGRSAGFAPVTRDGIEYFGKAGYRFDFARPWYGEVQILFRDLFAGFDRDIHRASLVLEGSSPYTQVKLSRPLSGHGYDGFRVFEIHRPGVAPSALSCRTILFRIEPGNRNQARITRPVGHHTRGTSPIPAIGAYLDETPAPHQVTHDRLVE